MGDPGMIGDSGFEKRLRDNVQRLDEKIQSEKDLRKEEVAHLRTEIKGNDRRYEERFLAQESAAKYVQEKTNEFRKALQDVGERQMPRTEAESELKAIKEHQTTEVKSIREQHAAGLKANSDKIEELRARMDRNEGREAVAHPMIEQLIREVKTLGTATSEGSGEKSGRLSQQQFLMGLALLVLAIISAILAVAKFGH